MNASAERLWFLATEVVIRVSSRDENHHVSVLEHRGAHGDGPPLHRHAGEDETFHVISGRLRMHLDGRELSAGPGDTVHLPANVPHTYKVVSPEGARFLTITGGQRFEAFVRAMARPAEGPGLPPQVPPTPEQVDALVRVAAEYGIEILGPPLA